MNPDEVMPEKFVDADTAGKFLALPRRRILELARRGILPGHPLGRGARRVWRFRLSELARAMESMVRNATDKNLNFVKRKAPVKR